MKNNIKNILRDEKGNVTIFYSITIVVLLFIMFIIIDSSRMLYSKNKVKRATLVALNTILADYNSELKERYGLLLIRDLDDYITEEEIQKEIQNNLYNRDMNNISILQVDIKSKENFMDLNVLDEQIRIDNHYMKKSKVVNLTKDIIKKIIEEKKGVEDIVIDVLTQEEYENTKEPNYEDKREKNLKETEKYVDDENIKDVVVSDELINYLSINSKKKYEFDYEKISDDVDKMYEKIHNNYLFDNYINEYILNRFKNYVGLDVQENKTYFDYEVEYIISGNISQRENISDIKTKLIILRMPNNIVNVYNNVELMSLIEVKAQLIAGWWGTQIAATIVKNALIISEAISMCMKDITIMMSGGKIEFLNQSNIYIDYETCLQLLLFTQSKESKLERIRDLIFLNMNKINSQFILEKTKSKLEVEVLYSEKMIFLDKINLFSENPYKYKKVKVCASY